MIKKFHDDYWDWAKLTLRLHYYLNQLWIPSWYNNTVRTLIVSTVAEVCACICASFNSLWAFITVIEANLNYTARRKKMSPINWRASIWFILFYKQWKVEWVKFKNCSLWSKLIPNFHITFQQPNSSQKLVHAHVPQLSGAKLLQQEASSQTMNNFTTKRFFTNVKY